MNVIKVIGGWLDRTFPDPASRPRPGGLPRVGSLPMILPDFPDSPDDIGPISIAMTYMGRDCAVLDGEDENGSPIYCHATALAITGLPSMSSDPITIHVSIPSRNLPKVMGLMQSAYWHYMKFHYQEERRGIVGPCESDSQ